MKNMLRALALVSVLTAGAVAEEWHGFDPTDFGGLMLKPEQLQAMVTELKQLRPPKNGDHYVFAFANLQRDMAFGIKVEEGIKANADSAGIELLVADNRLDGPTALANAESFVRRGVDFVIEFQTDVNFGPTIMQKFAKAGIGVVAIDIPMPGATFFGADNPRSGFMGGAYLGQAALARFGADQVAKGYLVVGELPQSGAIPAMRTEGQVAGFLAVLPDFPPEHLIRIDTKNTLQYSFQQMRNVLGRIPPGVPLMLTAINDQSVTGMLRAVQQANRQGEVIVVGNGADELETLAQEEAIVASVAYFPERYGNYLIPIGLMSLAKCPLPPAVLVRHLMVTRANICQYYPDYPCQEQGLGFSYAFPQEAFVRHLAGLKGKPDLAGYETLIPER
jgi:ribose transport system substrate-binding protein